jgi:hypothetical protein
MRLPKLLKKVKSLINHWRCSVVNRRKDLKDGKEIKDLKDSIGPLNLFNPLFLLNLRSDLHQVVLLLLRYLRNPFIHLIMKVF